jgi:hypothetical protein
VNVTLKVDPDPDTFEVNWPVIFFPPAKSFALDATAFAPSVTTIDPAVPAVKIGAFGVGIAIIAPKAGKNKNIISMVYKMANQDPPPPTYINCARARA